ncbi:MAG TPA: hypothetical protein ENK18_23700 [Deltaproteobacteria bacterium]|nr:hypothetical protein [Deltaproteobacteria bacterium]
MPHEIDPLLADFSERDYSVRLVRTVCNVVPFAPVLPDWFSLVEGLKILDPEAKRPVLERAQAISREPGPQRALWMVRALDTADTGIGVFSGVRSAYKLTQAKDNTERLDALETDPQQAVDAVLKGLAIAFIVHKLYPGSLSEKLAAFRESETGQAIVFYFAAIEVGLPFADNAVSGAGSLLGQLLDRFGADQQAKLAAVAGEEEAAQAMAMMRELSGPLDTMVGMAREHLGGIASAATGSLATAMNVGDKVAGVAATGADLLPVYRFLGARLVAEACLVRALKEEAEAQSEAVKRSAAAQPIKYTRSAADLPDAPARRRGCFGFGILLLAVGLATASMAWGA